MDISLNKLLVKKWELESEIQSNEACLAQSQLFFKLKPTQLYCGNAFGIPKSSSNKIVDHCNIVDEIMKYREELAFIDRSIKAHVETERERCRVAGLKHTEQRLSISFADETHKIIENRKKEQSKRDSAYMEEIKKCIDNPGSCGASPDRRPFLRQTHENSWNLPVCYE